MTTEGAQTWSLRLYVAGSTTGAARAREHAQRICDTHLGGRYVLDVVDLEDEPHRADEDQIIAVPTLVRTAPAPVRKIVGDLSNVREVLRGLGATWSGGDGDQP